LCESQRKNEGYAVNEYLDAHRRRRDTLVGILEPLEQGTFKLESNSGLGWTDKTQARIDATKRQIAELDSLIAHYEHPRG
jgi:hypothetical protein